MMMPILLERGGRQMLAKVTVEVIHARKASWSEWDGGDPGEDAHLDFLGNAVGEDGEEIELTDGERDEANDRFFADAAYDVFE